MYLWNRIVYVNDIEHIGQYVGIYPYFYAIFVWVFVNVLMGKGARWRQHQGIIWGVGLGILAFFEW
jgi:hypothetical protein